MFLVNDKKQGYALSFQDWHVCIQLILVTLKQDKFGIMWMFIFAKPGSNISLHSACVTRKAVISYHRWGEHRFSHREVCLHRGKRRFGPNNYHTMLYCIKPEKLFPKQVVAWKQMALVCLTVNWSATRWGASHIMSFVHRSKHGFKEFFF